MARRAPGSDGRRRGGLHARLRAELRYLLSVWKAGLLSAMEYRAAFVSQVLGMMLNNAAFLLFWVIFFARFPDVGGWQLPDLLLLFGVAAAAFGVAVVLFGNVLTLADVIMGGGLDHFLTLPRPVLLNVLSGRMRISGIGDIATGLICFLLAGRLDPAAWLRFGLAVTASAAIFLAFLVLVQSLAFWMGGATMLQQTAINAVITFATYPLALFDGTAKIVLLTVIPAGVIGTVSADFVRAFSWQALGQLLAAALILGGLALLTFRRGLRRYESGSAMVVVD